MFEYKIIERKNKTISTEELNRLGTNGWELVSTSYISGAGICYYFKRSLK